MPDRRGQPRRQRPTTRPGRHRRRRDTAEIDALALALGPGLRAAVSTRSAGPSCKDLERQHKRRATRIQRDLLDLALVDLVAFYRDVLVRQLGAAVAVANVDVRGRHRCRGGASTPERTLQRIEAILGLRTAVAGNVAPLLAVEAMTLSLR